MNARGDPLEGWLAALEARHLADLTFAEVRRALQALSSLYVERRARMRPGAALEGAGKRAAFALFYAPLHFLLVREIVRTVGARCPARRILDLGCGTGACGAAWALEHDPRQRPPLLGIDRSPWAAQEARFTYRALGLAGEARVSDLDRVRLGTEGVLAAFTVNELSPEARARLLSRTLEGARRGARILVVEPIARAVSPWWDEWRSAFMSAGGRADEWRFRLKLPALLRRLDEAAGLDHRELTGRSLWLGPGKADGSAEERAHRPRTGS